MNTLEYLQLTFIVKEDAKIDIIPPDPFFTVYGVFIYGDIKDGILRNWWFNNQLASQICFKNGLVSGEFKTWNSIGKLQLHKLYKEGILIENLK